VCGADAKKEKSVAKTVNLFDTAVINKYDFSETGYLDAVGNKMRDPPSPSLPKIQCRQEAMADKDPPSPICLLKFQRRQKAMADKEYHNGSEGIRV